MDVNLPILTKLYALAAEDHKRMAAMPTPPALPIGLSRLYDACLHDDWTTAEVQLIANDPTLARTMLSVLSHVWHPSTDELASYHVGTLDAVATEDIRYHLDVDRCCHCHS